MKLILRYIRPYRWYILAVMLIKLLGTGTDLLMPYVLEHLLDHVIPAASDAWPVIAWGCVMLLLTLITRILNVCANRMSVRVARNSTFAVRRDLFHTALNLSGSQMDRVGLPSLISRMTSDTYNVQSFIRMIQTMGIRSPIMLIGGAIITLTMDTGLAAILCVMAPIMIVLVCFVSWKGSHCTTRCRTGWTCWCAGCGRASPASGWSRPWARNPTKSAATARPTPA